MLRCLLVMLVALPLAAGNPLFIAGDSFFAVRLDRELAAALRAHPGGAFTFSYQRPYGAMVMMCGYYGIRTLRVDDLGVDAAHAIADAYDALREEEDLVVRHTRHGETDEPIEVEENPGYLLLYRADFDPQEHRIGLKYNQDWAVNASPKDPSHAVYDHFVTDMVVRDWRDATLVDPLPLVQEEAPAGMGEGLLSVDADALSFITCTGSNLQRVAEQRDHAWFVRIDRHGVLTRWKREPEAKQWTVIVPPEDPAAP